jgi:5'-methylthioadenosine phosphorylase
VGSLLGIIGGSGVYDIPGVRWLKEERVDTPWGEPSDCLMTGEISGKRFIFLSRHSRRHDISPSDINYRANIFALKSFGVTDILSLSACGSFREDLAPRSFLLIDQYIDLTRNRHSSFFGKGCVAHVSMARPTSKKIQSLVIASAERASIPVIVGGTYVCIEGPHFSTFAESVFFKKSGFDVIGMTAMPEAKLAREAEIPYATLAMVTDFDCWRDNDEAVDVTAIVEVMKSNNERAAKLIISLVENFPTENAPCPNGSDRALDNAIITSPNNRDPEMVKKLSVILSRVNR